MEDIYINQLKEIYKEKGVYYKDEESPLLHESCVSRAICWKSNMTAVNENKIQKPYIGANYKNQLLGVGINLYEHGGWESITHLFRGKEVEEKKEKGAMDFLKNGKKRINFDAKDYGGTLIFHRLAVYATIILEKEIKCDGKYVLSSSGKNIYDDFELLINTTEKIAFVNAVKCSPKGNYSRPTQEMQNICPQLFLFKEILVLKPEFVLILGKTVFYALKSIRINSFSIEEGLCYSRCGSYKMTIDNQTFKGFWVVHPQYRKGGSSLQIAPELFKLRE